MQTARQRQRESGRDMNSPSDKDLGLTFDETGFSVRDGRRFEWQEFDKCRASVDADTRRYEILVIPKGTDTDYPWGHSVEIPPPVYYTSAALAQFAAERINEEYQKHLDASGV